MCKVHVEGVGPPYTCPNCAHRLRLGLVGTRMFRHARPWILTAFAIALAWLVLESLPMIWLIVRSNTERLADPASLLQAVATVAGAICAVAGCALALRARDEVRDAQTIARLPKLFFGAAASIGLITLLELVKWVSMFASGTFASPR